MFIFILNVSKSYLHSPLTLFHRAALCRTVVSIWKVIFNNDVVNGSLDSIKHSSIPFATNHRTNKTEDMEVILRN